MRGNGEMLSTGHNNLNFPYRMCNTDVKSNANFEDF